MFTSASCCVCVVCVSSNVFGVSSSSSARCVVDGFDPEVCCVDDGPRVFGVGVCVGGCGGISLESLMEGFSFAVTPDCFSAKAFSFGRKNFQFLFIKC